MPLCDAMFLAPHPDDVEIAAAGTILRCVARGQRVVVVDATRGEKGSRGTETERAAEAAAAARLLGVVARENLGLPDTQVQADDQSVRKMVALMRLAKPTLLFAPVERDVHPDHVAVAILAARAFFLAGLRNYAPELGVAHRPRLLIRFPGNVPLEPTFAVDIGELAERKAEVLRCYKSQLQPPTRDHLVTGLDVLERAQARDRFWGARVGCAAAEPFALEGPLPLRDLAPLMG